MQGTFAVATVGDPGRGMAAHRARSIRFDAVAVQNRAARFADIHSDDIGTPSVSAIGCRGCDGNGARQRVRG